MDPLRALLMASVVLTAPSSIAEPVAPEPVVIRCDGIGEARPSSIQIGCATGSVLVSGIRWSRWDANGAKGSGSLVVNSCIYAGGPTCVEGQTTTYPASLRLGRPASGPGITAFSELTLRFPDGGPAGLSRGVYRLDNPLRP